MDGRKGGSLLPIQKSSLSSLFSAESSNQKSLMSPVTELAVSMEQSFVSTPRRKLSLSCNTPVSEICRWNVSEAESQGGEYLQFDSPTLENIRSSKFSRSKYNDSTDLRRIMARRSFSSPVCSGINEEQSNISEPCFQESAMKGLREMKYNHSEENHSDSSLYEMADEFIEGIKETDFCIRKRMIGKRSNSAPAGNLDFNFVNIPSSDSNIDMKGTCDDGFLKEITHDGEVIPASIIPNIIGLIDAPIFMNINFAESPTSKCFKKSNRENQLRKREKPESSPYPLSRKKRQKYARSQSFYDSDPVLPRFCMHTTPVRAIQRSYSFDAQSTKSPSIDITSLLDIDEKMLIGDRSREYCLPIVNSKHPDLKGITAETLCDVIDEKYSNVINEYLIVDCRYPYEYNGGHIRGARNLYEKSQVVQEFLKNPKAGNRQIIIFHCEFSSKRGPSLCRFLRNKDRELNEYCYPKLYYPELYLLDGGYKEFYERKMEYCEPQSYRKMDDPEFSKELKIFAKRSKSWAEGTDHKERHRTGLRY